MSVCTATEKEEEWKVSQARKSEETPNRRERESHSGNWAPLLPSGSWLITTLLLKYKMKSILTSLLKDELKAEGLPLPPKHCSLDSTTGTRSWIPQNQIFDFPGIRTESVRQTAAAQVQRELDSTR